jgi:hypothetical protein
MLLGFFQVENVLYTSEIANLVSKCQDLQTNKQNAWSHSIQPSVVARYDFYFKCKFSATLFD